jgi:hypothetical protein
LPSTLGRQLGEPDGWAASEACVAKASETDSLGYGDRLRPEDGAQRTNAILAHLPADPAIGGEGDEQAAMPVFEALWNDKA